MAFPIAAALAIAAEAAPFIAKHLFGERAGEAAEKVVNGALAVTGAKTPEEALAALRADSAAKLAFQTKMAELDAEMERAYLADRADARKRDAAFITTGRRNYRADIMLGMAFGSTVCIAAFMIFGQVDGNSAVGGLLIGVAGAFVKMIGDAFAFEFGSSRSSKDKDATFATLIKNGHG